MEKALKAVGYVGVGFLFGLAIKTIYSGTFKYDSK